MASVLRTEALTKRYGALLVTDAVSIDIQEGELHAFIGPNGAGKTTLINQLSGELRPNEGTISFGGEDVTSLPVHGRARRADPAHLDIRQPVPAQCARAEEILPHIRKPFGVVPTQLGPPRTLRRLILDPLRHALRHTCQRRRRE